MCLAHCLYKMVARALEMEVAAQEAYANTEATHATNIILMRSTLVRSTSFLFVRFVWQARLQNMGTMSSHHPLLKIMHSGQVHDFQLLENRAHNHLMTQPFANTPNNC